MTEEQKQRLEAVFPLALARTGEELVIAGIRGGKGLNHKLMEQGIRPGIAITIIQKRGGGFVLGFDGQRIALGAGMAQKLFVSLVNHRLVSGQVH
jgi:Fe2+ transport system protein FeoA